MDLNHLLHSNGQLEGFAQTWSSNQEQQQPEGAWARGNELEDASRFEWLNSGAGDWYGQEGSMGLNSSTEGFYALPTGLFDPSPMVPRMLFHGPAPTISSNEAEVAASGRQPTSPAKTGPWDADETSRLLQLASFTEANSWEDVYRQLQTTRSLSSVKYQFYNFKNRYYHPAATRSFDPTPAPQIIGPAPCPDWKPWSSAEHAAFLAILKPGEKQDWSGIQKNLGTGRSISELHRHLGLRKGSRSVAKAVVAVGEVGGGGKHNSPDDTSSPSSSSPAPFSSSPVAQARASSTPKPIQHRSPAPAAPRQPQSHQTPAMQNLAPPPPTAPVVYNLLSSIADILFSSSSAAEHPRPTDLNVCRCCSKPIAKDSEGKKRVHEEEGEEGNVAQKRRREGQTLPRRMLKARATADGRRKERNIAENGAVFCLNRS